MIIVVHGPVRCLRISRSRTHCRDVHRLPRRCYPASCVPGFLSSAASSTFQQCSDVFSCAKELGNRLHICMHLGDRCCCLVLGMRYRIGLISVRPNSSMRLLASRQPFFQNIRMKRPMHWCRICHIVLLKRGITLITFCGFIALTFGCSNQLRKFYLIRAGASCCFLSRKTSLGFGRWGKPRWTGGILIPASQYTVIIVALCIGSPPSGLPEWSPLVLTG